MTQHHAIFPTRNTQQQHQQRETPSEGRCPHTPPTSFTSSSVFATFADLLSNTVICGRIPAKRPTPLPPKVEDGDDDDGLTPDGDALLTSVETRLRTHCAVIDFGEITPFQNYTRSTSSLPEVTWQTGVFRLRWRSERECDEASSSPLIHPYDRPAAVVGLMHCPSFAASGVSLKDAFEDF